MASPHTDDGSPKSPEEDHYDASEAEIVSHQAQHTIEARDVDDFTDDGFASDSRSATSISLPSSMRDYNFENGRRYHKFREGHYQFPNDEPEQAREDMKHAMIVNLCGGRLHYAPIETAQEVLDMGTGTGICCIDSAFGNLHTP